MDTATEKYYQDRIAELEVLFLASTDYARDTKEAELAKSLEMAQARAERYTDSYNTASVNHADIVEGMRVWTLSELSNEDISETQAESIEAIMGFELTEEFEVTVTIEYFITVNARNKDVAREVVDRIDFESVNYDSNRITYFSATVERIDF